ncbi:MAG: bifunctional phosphopantothenoylcysteine decarboxylase/phosphopantothenate--cysteine ligase CoaBC [Ignavibacteria bacterium]|nr:bifunctional phosphopantothenoylcysteine decarboxylase/phosphopantothenate--cysteine ligase CoaBC [Ignavibacteria bacterium]
MSGVHQKKILLGICGGIAAYKSCELVRLFRKNGAEVRVIATPSALKFVSPVTLSVLSGNEVMVNMFPENINSDDLIKTETSHIYSGIWGDIFLIAPATANTIAKIACGISDNLLTATVVSSRCPVIVCPAMDEDMYVNEITLRNLSVLKESGYVVIDPEKGELASGLYGVGRLPEPEKIYKFVSDYLEHGFRDFMNRKFLITAGPTYEPIDEVRFIGNYSSGRMGFSLAKAAVDRGAEVTLISGPVNLHTPRKVNRINVKTADEMLSAVKQNINDKDYVIMSAAVSDFKPTEFYSGKIKKNHHSNLTINTEPTPDILDFLGKHKSGFKLIGFALETENEYENAKQKLINKNLDIIVVNNPRVQGAGFGTDTNVITIIDKNLNEKKFPSFSKYDASWEILNSLKTI